MTTIFPVISGFQDVVVCKYDNVAYAGRDERLLTSILTKPPVRNKNRRGAFVTSISRDLVTEAELRWRRLSSSWTLLKPADVLRSLWVWNISSAWPHFHTFLALICGVEERWCFKQEQEGEGTTTSQFIPKVGFAYFSALICIDLFCHFYSLFVTYKF